MQHVSDPAALTEFRYQNKCYALPDKYTFYMMFYRKDILSELNEAVPTTWKQMYSLLPKLQNQHMTIGLPNISENIIDIFTTLLYQNGGTVYDEKLTKSVLDEEPSLEAFKQFTDFYTKYKVYQKIDALTYFRTGQTPIVIMPYTFFANLQAGQPLKSGDSGDLPKCPERFRRTEVLTMWFPVLRPDAVSSVTVSIKMPHGLS